MTKGHRLLFFGDRQNLINEGYSSLGKSDPLLEGENLFSIPILVEPTQCSLY